jgi:hypothetical protein
MPTSTYKALATVTLASTASSVSFDSIPAFYRDLVLVMDTALTASSSVILWLNGDTTSANYPNVWMQSPAVASGAGLVSGARISVTNYTTGPAQSRIDFLDYSATDKHKTMLVRHDLASTETVAVANRWANTAAISGIGIIPVGTTFTVGSRFDLYGIAS